MYRAAAGDEPRSNPGKHRVTSHRPVDSCSKELLGPPSVSNLPPVSNEKLDRDGLAALLGARVTEDAPDRLAVEMDLTPDHFDADGQVVPSVMCALADCAMSLISNRTRTEVAVVAHIRLTRPEVRGGRLRAAIAVVGQIGGTTNDWRAVVSVDEAEVAEFTGSTFAVGG